MAIYFLLLVTVAWHSFIPFIQMKSGIDTQAASISISSTEFFFFFFFFNFKEINVAIYSFVIGNSCMAQLHSIYPDEIWNGCSGSLDINITNRNVPLTFFFQIKQSNNISTFPGNR